MQGRAPLWQAKECCAAGRRIREPRAKNMPPACFCALRTAALFESTFTNAHTQKSETPEGVSLFCQWGTKKMDLCF